MASIVQDIMAEYQRLRQTGMDAKAVLRALGGYIAPLEADDKDELAKLVRSWEKAYVVGSGGATVEVETIKTSQKPSPIKPIKPLKPKPIEPEMTLSTAEIACANCGRMNSVGNGYCVACGFVLETASTPFATQHFGDSDSLVKDDYFDPSATLLMELRDAKQYYEIRPQEFEHEMIIGRSTGNSAMMPDVDLAEYGGADYGVSRLHMAMKYVPEDNAIQVYDLGSANGSYINGQRLHAKEVRVLRHGDELRLGRMVLRIHFRTKPIK